MAAGHKKTDPDHAKSKAMRLFLNTIALSSILDPEILEIIGVLEEMLARQSRLVVELEKERCDPSDAIRLRTQIVDLLDNIYAAIRLIESRRLN